MDAGVVAGLVMGAGAVGTLIFDKVNERRKTKRSGLPPNPVRCQEHQEAINEIKADVKIIKQKLDIV